MTLEPEFESQLDNLDETEGIPDNDILTFVEENTYIGFRSSPTSHATSKSQFEPFYIFYVTKKVEEAPENKSDIFGNVVMKGDHHLIGYCLEKVQEKKNKVFYKMNKKEVFIHSIDLFIPLIAVNEKDLSIEKSEYIYIADCALVK